MSETILNTLSTISSTISDSTTSETAITISIIGLVISSLLTLGTLAFIAVQTRILMKQFERDAKWKKLDMCLTAINEHEKIRNDINGVSGLSEKLVRLEKLADDRERGYISDDEVNVETKKLTDEIIEEIDTNKMRGKFFELLMFFDRIALGMDNDYYDKETIKRYLKSSLIKAYKCGKRYIMNDAKPGSYNALKKYATDPNWGDKGG